MNIVKLQNQLKSIPVETLIKYVQGLNPEVPSYLALAEIKNRKDMEAKYASQNQQAPEKSVAEDLTQAPDQSGLAMLAGNPMGNPAPQGAPTDQGVAGLPIPDQMFSGQGMAAGGIVAFDDGGDVAASDMAPGSDLPSTEGMSDIQRSLMGRSPVYYTGATAGPAFASSSPYGTDMTGEMMRVSPEALRYSLGVGRGTSPYAGAAYSGIRKEMGSPGYADGGMVAFGPGGDVASKRYQAALEDSYFSPGSIYAGAKDLLGMPFQYGWTTDPVTGKLVRKKDIEGMTPSLDAYRKAAELRKQGLLAEADTLEKAAASPQVNRKGLASIDTSTAEPGMMFSRDEIANIYQSTLPPTKTKAPMAEAVPQNDVTKPMPGSAPQPQQAGIDSLLENTEGVAKDRMSRYKEMIGEDPERGRLEELARKYETGAKEQERMAPWMALTKAGFSMAGGKSPFAIQNLAEGAQAGLADYVQAKDKLDKLTEKQIDIRTKMGQAKRAEDIAAATYGLNSEERIEARNAQIKLKDMEEKNAFTRTKYAADVSTKNAMIAAAKKSDYETFMDLAKQDDDNYKTVKDKDGNVKKVFDAGKVTQVWKSFSGSSGLDDDKILAMWQQEKMLDPKFNKSFQDYKNEIRGASGSPVSAMPAGVKVTRTQ
jgi:hypothetical protein